MCSHNTFEELDLGSERLSKARQLQLIFVDPECAASLSHTKQRRFQAAWKASQYPSTVDVPVHELKRLDPRNVPDERCWRDRLRSFLNTREKQAVLTRLVFVNGHDKYGDPTGPIFFDKDRIAYPGFTCNWQELQEGFNNDTAVMSAIEVWIGFPLARHDEPIEDDYDEQEIQRLLNDFEYYTPLDNEKVRYVMVHGEGVLKESKTPPKATFQMEKPLPWVEGWKAYNGLPEDDPLNTRRSNADIGFEHILREVGFTRIRHHPDWQQKEMLEDAFNRAGFELSWQDLDKDRITLSFKRLPARESPTTSTFSADPDTDDAAPMSAAKTAPDNSTSPEEATNASGLYGGTVLTLRARRL